MKKFEYKTMGYLNRSEVEKTLQEEGQSGWEALKIDDDGDFVEITFKKEIEEENE